MWRFLKDHFRKRDKYFDLNRLVVATWNVDRVSSSSLLFVILWFSSSHKFVVVLFLLLVVVVHSKILHSSHVFDKWRGFLFYAPSNPPKRVHCRASATYVRCTRAAAITTPWRSESSRWLSCISTFIVRRENCEKKYCFESFWKEF